MGGEITPCHTAQNTQRLGAPKQSCFIARTPYYTALEDPNRSLLYKRVLVAPAKTCTDAGPFTVPAPQPCADESDVDVYVPADEAAVKRWHRKLGLLAARDALERDVARACPPGTTVWLQELPSGYTLYVHKKGHRHSPRRDYYLYGSRHTVAFRSPEEFAPHLVWLLSGQPMSDGGVRECECKYCGSVRSQREINVRRRGARLARTRVVRAAARPLDWQVAASSESEISCPAVSESMTRLAVGRPERILRLQPPNYYRKGPSGSEPEGSSTATASNYQMSRQTVVKRIVVHGVPIKDYRILPAAMGPRQHASVGSPSQA